MRVLFLALALVLMPVCALAQTGRNDQSETPIVRATANVIVQALAPSEYGNWGYRWDAVSVRVSRFVHWHIYEPDRRDRPAATVVRRNGWVESPGAQIGVSVFGGDAAVTLLSFEYDEFTNLDLLDALRDVGANVSFQADYESYSEYVVALPGRRAGLLTLRHVCGSPQSARAPHCHDEAELTFSVE